MRRKIVVFVLAAHALLLLTLVGDHWVRRAMGLHQKILVRTQVVVLRTVDLAPVGVNIAAQEPVVVSTKPVAKQKAASQRVAKKKAPTKSGKARQTETALLQEITQSLDRLSSPTPAATKAELQVPTLDLQIQASEASAAELVAAFLQEELVLPEFGEVKVSLSLSQFGEVQELAILETHSLKNEEFLKKRLPELTFPCLNGNATLTIVFSNAL